MAGRLWNLRLNMDLFNGAYMKLRNDSDRLEYFLGWHLGCLDGELSEGDSKQFQAGFEVGHAMIEEAKAFSEKQSLRGQASAESRRASRGTAQPSRTEHRTVSEPPFEPPFGDSSNQSTIHNPQSTIEQTKKPKRAKGTYSSEVLAIYDAYPRKDGPGACSKQIAAALEIEPFDSLLEATQAFCAAVRKWDQEDQDQYTPMASTWFSQQRWLADRKTWERKSKSKTLKNGVQHNGFAETDYTAGLDSVPSY